MLPVLKVGDILKRGGGSVLAAVVEAGDFV